ncbi:MAG: glycosyltransferase family 2 protein [Cellulosilyticaceae bacterium]
MSKVLVSIIVPIYNAHKYLDKCLKSLQHQSEKHFEVIMIDDGSTDNSVEIGQRYTIADKRFKLIQQINSGPSTARNKGIEYSRGEYIVFLDADDYIEQNMLEVLLRKAQHTKADIVTCGYKEIGTHKRTLWVNDFKECLNIKSLEDYIKIILLTTGGVIWGKIFRANIIKDNGIRFDARFKMCEDQLFNIKSFCYAQKIISINEYLYCYRRDNINSLSNNGYINNLQNQLAIQQEIEQVLEQYLGYRETTNQCLARRLYQYIISVLYESYKNNDKEIRYIIKEDYIKEKLKSFIPIGIREKVTLKVLLTNNIFLIKTMFRCQKIIASIKGYIKIE